MKAWIILLFWPVVLHAQVDKAVPIVQAMSNMYNIYGDKFTGTCFMVTRKLAETVSQNAAIPDELAKYQDTIAKFFDGNGFSMDSVLVTVGSETYFLGYPLGNLGTEVFGIKFPLLKKAVISGYVRHNGVDVLLLDGHNNLGFSGGPLKHQLHPRLQALLIFYDVELI